MGENKRARRELKELFEKQVDSPDFPLHVLRIETGDLLASEMIVFLNQTKISIRIPECFPIYPPLCRVMQHVGNQMPDFAHASTGMFALQEWSPAQELQSFILMIFTWLSPVDTQELATRMQAARQTNAWLSKILLARRTQLTSNPGRSANPEQGCHQSKEAKLDATIDASQLINQEHSSHLKQTQIGTTNEHKQSINQEQVNRAQHTTSEMTHDTGESGNQEQGSHVQQARVAPCFGSPSVMGVAAQADQELGRLDGCSRVCRQCTIA